ncbi:hypothetical protein NBO_111g0003 [Nosema bombycis CQ1]|uniref:Thioredoxin domain-containing protein n=1 Tax=Nosema bombycis (strain CQ1 / CVCC 102059) TaxID=578461 RepID=R0KSL8_NOSB1|nr:hypothetical protein NBO_111g0003 [Nosema bombycis CQ1]|eukprot:EOB13212.1 hypothetical protein NBO_111g0003 [Nosema bombycis CQ1]
MLFTASLLPKIEIPTLVIYNPKDKKFYHKKKNLNEFNFKEVAEETLKLFDQGKLKVYGSKNYGIYYLIGGLIVMGVIGCWIKMRRKPII